MAAIHPMVFSIKSDVKKLEERIKKIEDGLSTLNKEALGLQSDVVLSKEQDGH